MVIPIDDVFLVLSSPEPGCKAAFALGPMGMTSIASSTLSSSSTERLSGRDVFGLNVDDAEGEHGTGGDAERENRLDEGRIGSDRSRTSSKIS